MSEAFTLHHGNCIDAMRAMPDASVDAIVTDPPYGLTANKKGGSGVASVNLESPHGRARIGTGNGAGGFMGMKWDDDVPSVEVWAECLRVLKPGGHLLAFAGTRTQHRMATRIEDAGFEIRDMIAWVYGSGFPKSRNIAELDMEGESAEEWAGWGTALKPALEPITLARKPMACTVAANLQEHGTGAMNIDACRVHAHDSQGYAYAAQRMAPGADQNRTGKTHQDGAAFEGRTKDGRWPANLIHDGSDDVLGAFPDAPGQLADASASASARKTQNVFGAMRRGRGEEASADSDNEGTVGCKMKPGARRLDEGSAARFFYCAKASAEDRHEGLPHPGPQFRKGSTLRDAERVGAARGGNFHPTVKPTALMRYLCRLVTPPGGGSPRPIHGLGQHRQGSSARGLPVYRDRARRGRARQAARVPRYRACPHFIRRPHGTSDLAPGGRMKRHIKNPTAWANTITARQSMPSAIADNIMTKLHSALGDLKAGSTDDDLFDCLGAAINVGLVRAEQIHPRCVTPMLAARDALIRCDEIRGRHGRYGFDGPGLAAMAEGLEVYEEMVRNSTPQQMREAMTVSIARMRRQAAQLTNH